MSEFKWDDFEDAPKASCAVILIFNTPVSLEITNIQGQVIYKNTTTENDTKTGIDIALDNNVPSGMYLLTLRSQTASKTIKFIISK